MSTAKRLERIEKRLGVRDREDGEDGIEEVDVPVAGWLRGRRLLLELRGPLATPAEQAAHAADEAWAASQPAGATVRERRLRPSEGVRRQLEAMRATCRQPSPHAPPRGEPDPDWLGPPERPFAPAELARRGVEREETEEDG